MALLLPRPRLQRALCPRLRRGCSKGAQRGRESYHTIDIVRMIKLPTPFSLLMRHGVAYLRKEEAAYAEQVRARLEKQLHRRAKELGYELKKIEPNTETIAM